MFSQGVSEDIVKFFAEQNSDKALLSWVSFSEALNN